MEPNNTKAPLLYERFALWIRQVFQTNKAPIFASLIFSALAYLFAFTNKLVNGDEVGALFSKGATTSSGRWGLELLYRLFPNFSMPWLHGVVTIALITAAICLIIHIFRIRNHFFQILLAGSIIVFPSLIGTFSFMFTSSSYGLAFLFAVLAVWCVNQKSIKWFIAALGCMIFSLSIYQAYISIAASLLILILIQQLLDGDSVPSVIRNGFLFLAFLIASLGLYYLSAKLILSGSGSNFNSYAGDAIQFSLASIPRGVIDAYYSFLGFFTQGFYALIPTTFSRIFHAAALIACMLLLLIWMLAQEKTDWLRLLGLLAMLALLPLAINCMYLFVAFDSIHTLVLYSFVAVYILAILLAEHCLQLDSSKQFMELVRRCSIDLVVLALIVTIACNIFIANQAYLQLYLEYENTYAFYTALVADMKQMPEFQPDTKLAIIGEYQPPTMYQDYFGNSSGIAGIHFGPGGGTKWHFLHYYLGFTIPFASDAEITAIQTSEEFMQMEIYPYYGSMQMIGDTLVVKLS